MDYTAKLAPEVQERVGQTFGWLGYGLLTTAVVVEKMRRNFYF